MEWRAQLAVRGEQRSVLSLDAYPLSVRAAMRVASSLVAAPVSILRGVTRPRPRGLTRVCLLVLCRFYYYNSYKDFHPHLIGATALYLASKVEEHPVTPKAIALAGSQVIAGNQVNSRAHALRARRRRRACRAHTARVRLACRRLDVVAGIPSTNLCPPILQALPCCE